MFLSHCEIVLKASPPRFILVRLSQPFELLLNKSMKIVNESLRVESLVRVFGAQNVDQERPDFL